MKLHFVYALGAISLLSCQSKQTEENPPDQEKNYCISETLKKNTHPIPLEEQVIYEQLTLTGKVSYNENDLVAFKSLLEGIVEQVKFELGDRVRKGQVLATVNSIQIQDLYQQKSYYQNQIDLLEKVLKNKQTLLADGMTSSTDVLETEHELANGRLELDKINQNLSLYRASDTKGQFQIIAPKDGFVVQKNMSVGQSVTSDEGPLFAISNLNQIWVMVNIYANNLQYIKEGDAVKVRTLAYPDELYDGKIDKIYKVFDEDEHVLKARVVLENNNINLMPGMSADILIRKNNSVGKGFAIPRNSVVFHNNKEYVIGYKDDCTLQIFRIEPFASNEEIIYVKEGLADFTQIIDTNALLIFEEINK